jgi:uncharacterized protein (DUF1684 family)
MQTLFRLKNREYILSVFSCLCLAALFTFSGCGKSAENDATKSATIDDTDVYTLEVRKDRLVKDRDLLSDANSPIKASDMEFFNGLAYFPVNRDFVFFTALQPLDNPSEVTIATSKDRPRQMLHIGALPFTYEGKAYAVQVYAPKDTTDGNYWFIPFTDATSGGTTYGGGRYIDIEDVSADSLFLDFNYAYNPYCSYNERYDCPIPPPENALPIAIEAGEKEYPLHHGK